MKDFFFRYFHTLAYESMTLKALTWIKRKIILNNSIDKMHEARTYVIIHFQEKGNDKLHP